MYPIQKKWEIIQRISDYRQIAVSDSEVKYPNDFKMMSLQDQHEVLRYFQKLKIINITKQPFRTKNSPRKGFYILKVYSNKFEEFYRKIHRGYQNHANKLDLKKNPQSPTFKPEEGIIRWGRQKCPLSPADKIYRLANVIFSRPLGQRINEDEVFEEMFDKSDLQKIDFGKIRFIVRNLNKRIGDTLGVSNAIEYKGKTVRFHSELFTL